MNGRFANASFNTTVALFIVGINHNASVEGENLIHFEVFKSTIDETLYSFTDNDYGSTGSSNSLRMNISDDNSCGWQNSFVRMQLNNDPTSSTSGFTSILPDDLRAVMKQIRKYSYSGGQIRQIQDYVCICSEIEVFGNITHGPVSEITYQKQYEYYASGNSAVHYSIIERTPCDTWLRTIYMDNVNDAFVCIGSNGRVNGYGASKSLGVSPLIFV